MLSRIKTIRLLNAPKQINIFCYGSKLQAHLRLCRMDKPIGTLLLYYPCMWGTILGQAQFDAYEIIFYGGLFALGAISMRSAGCIVNDMWDRDIDIKVERTRNRPLASGELSMNEASMALALNLTVGLGVVTQLSWMTIAASFAIVPVAFLYPLAKRYFKYPQLVLGLNYNWGIIVGALSTGGTIPTAALLCYSAAVLQTLIYDTLYGHQDVKFDKELGLYSTAHTLPINTPLYLSFPMSGLMVLTSLTAGFSYLTLPMIGAMQMVLYRQLKKLNFDDVQECGKFFRGFHYYQSVLVFIFCFGSYFAQK